MGFEPPNASHRPQQLPLNYARVLAARHRLAPRLCPGHGHPTHEYIATPNFRCLLWHFLNLLRVSPTSVLKDSTLDEFALDARGGVGGGGFTLCLPPTCSLLCSMLLHRSCTRYQNPPAPHTPPLSVHHYLLAAIPVLPIAPPVLLTPTPLPHHPNEDSELNESHL